jgi:hypothetical protein
VCSLEAQLPAERECGLAASLAAAICAKTSNERRTSDADGLRARMIGRLRSAGLEDIGWPEAPSSPVSWCAALAPAIRTRGLPPVLRSWLHCIPEVDEVVWKTDDLRTLANLVTVLFELRDEYPHQSILTSRSTWTQASADSRIADRCVLIDRTPSSAPDRRIDPIALNIEFDVEIERLARDVTIEVEAERGLIQTDNRTPLECVPDLEGQSARARSAAEAFLFGVLERRDTTRGVFSLNVETAFDFGTRPCELDLGSLDLRIAIEIDGFYHFLDGDAWRRDRRKDLLLQMHDFVVMRLLAEDVVDRLPDALITIDRVVEHRRSIRPAPPSHPTR